MEKLKLVIIALFVGMFFSCNSYLDLKPYGQVIPKTPDEFASLLNTMLYDIDFRHGMEPRFFRAQMINGVVSIPKALHNEVNV